MREYFIPCYVFDAMGAGLPEETEDAPIVRLSVQPGTVCPHALYFAFTQPAANEQRFLRKMDTAAIVTQVPLEGFPCILVPDVEKAYFSCCDALRQRVPQAKGVLVTGPKGKTLTRQLIAHVLKAQGGLLDIADGFQVDMTPWQSLHPYHQYWLQELRPDNPMGVSAAARAAAPTICVVTGPIGDLQGLTDGFSPDSW